MQRATSLEKSLMLGKIEAGGKRDDREWDGWMASLTQWTWVWANSEIVKDREAWHAAVHEVSKSHTWLRNWTTPQSGRSGEDRNSDPILANQRPELLTSYWSAEVSLFIFGHILCVLICVEKWMIDQISLHENTWECTLIWSSFWNSSQV